MIIGKFSTLSFTPDSRWTHGRFRFEDGEITEEIFVGWSVVVDEITREPVDGEVRTISDTSVEPTFLVKEGDTFYTSTLTMFREDREPFDFIGLVNHE